MRGERDVWREEMRRSACEEDDRRSDIATPYRKMLSILQPKSQECNTLTCGLIDEGRANAIRGEHNSGRDGSKVRR